MLALSQDIKYIQGVGPVRAELLEKELGIKTVGDMLNYYPYKYIDRTKFYRISEINGNMPYVQLIGEVLSFEEIGEGRNRRIVGHFSDGTGVIDLVWFQGLKYISQNYKVHTPYVIFGKPQVFKGRLNVAHPEIEKADPALLAGREMHFQNYQQQIFLDDEYDEFPLPEEASQGVPVQQQSNPQVQSSNLKVQSKEVQSSNLKPQSSLRPAYNTTEKMKKRGLNSNGLAKITASILSLMDSPLPETLPDYLIHKYNFISYDEAMRAIHYPSDPDVLRRAQARLKFEELFYVQMNILKYTKERTRKIHGINMPLVGEPFNDFFYHHLPFQLTNAQKRVIREVREDMRSGKQMNRLLQGDVGSGKTLVALMCMLIAVGNRHQACIMAPTEILAEQHLATIRQFLGDMPVRVELLTGSVKGKKRKQILTNLLNGDIDILVGTHAVIEDTVVFAKLGFVVIDEQHRFGVAQRAKLWLKNDTAPHVLVMTATPIPRTLAMTLYGDLDVSVIDELPPGRKPIHTIHQFDAHRKSLYLRVQHEIELGRQIYFVYPLIKESEKLDMKNLEEGYENVCKAFPHCKVSKVHGQLKPADKDAEMQRFARGETQIMVATTVIEVGVNVPNASVMIIENAERFGLSQLHQLRGRVGRGADQSYCILVTKFNISNETRKRIQIMVDSNDGFEIAEQDLKLRGPGDLEGTQQSGMAFDLRIANIARDGIILQMARDAAQQIVDNDIDQLNPQYAIVWKHLRELRKNQINWGAIS